MVIVEFKGRGGGRAQREVANLLRSGLGLGPDEVLLLPSERALDSFEDGELEDMVRPKNIKAVILGQINWLTGRVQRGRLRLVLWTAEGKTAELTVEVTQSGRLINSGKDLIEQRLAPMVQQAFTQHEPPDPSDAATEEVTQAPETSIDPVVENLRARVEALEENQRSFASTVDRLRLQLDEDVDLFVAGAIRLQLSWRAYDEESVGTLGESSLTSFNIQLGGSYNGISLEAEYRFFGFGMDALQTANIGYEVGETLDFKIGVTLVPFGLLPWASHSWAISTVYYFGLENDRDLGAHMRLHLGKATMDLAFFKGEEYGNPFRRERTSFDIVRVDTNGDGVVDQNNEEVNQFNGRVAYTVSHGDDGSSTEIGASGQYGFLRNHTTGKNGFHFAAAAHVDGNYGPLELQAQGGRYEYRPENPSGVSQDVVYLGAFGLAYPTAARAYFANANAAWTFTLDSPPLNLLVCYVDYGIVLKDTFANTQRVTPGCMLNAGKTWTFFDFNFARNQIGHGGGRDANANGHGASTAWEFRLNINTGYHF